MEWTKPEMTPSAVLRIVVVLIKNAQPVRRPSRHPFQRAMQNIRSLLEGLEEVVVGSSLGKADATVVGPWTGALKLMDMH